MKLTQLFALAALSLMGLTIFSCGNDDEVKVDPTAERMRLLTNNSGKQWLYTAQLVDGKDITTDCQRDIVWTFRSDGLMEMAFNDPCGEDEDGRLSQFTWKLDEESISLMNDTWADTLEIIELTSTKLVLQSEDESDGINYETQIIFSAK